MEAELAGCNDVINSHWACHAYRRFLSQGKYLEGNERVQRLSSKAPEKFVILKSTLIQRRAQSRNDMAKHIDVVLSDCYARLVHP